jgi:CrcB protein
MTIPPLHLALVFVGGGLGAVLRYGVTLASLAIFGPAFPWGTLAINVVGSALMGIFAAWIVAVWTPGGGGDGMRLFLMTGILGGFTTFSAFSLEAVTLWQRGEGGAAALYVAGSVVASILALAAGAAATRAVLVG